MEWIERIDQLLYDGEREERRVEVGDATVVVTSHRVLAFTPENEPRYRHVDRPNVGSVTIESRGRLRHLVWSVLFALVGFGAAAGTVAIDFVDLVPEPTLGEESGDGGVAATDLAGDTFEGLEATLAALEYAVVVASLLSLAVACGFLVWYLRTRSRTLVIEVHGEDNLEVPVGDVTVGTAAIELQNAIDPEPTLEDAGVDRPAVDPLGDGLDAGRPDASRDDSRDSIAERLSRLERDRGAPGGTESGAGATPADRDRPDASDPFARRHDADRQDRDRDDLGRQDGDRFDQRGRDSDAFSPADEGLERRDRSHDLFDPAVDPASDRGDGDAAEPTGLDAFEADDADPLAFGDDGDEDARDREPDERDAGWSLQDEDEGPAPGAEDEGPAPGAEDEATADPGGDEGGTWDAEADDRDSVGEADDLESEAESRDWDGADDDGTGGFVFDDEVEAPSSNNVAGGDSSGDAAGEFATPADDPFDREGDEPIDLGRDEPIDLEGEEATAAGVGDFESDDLATGPVDQLERSDEPVDLGGEPVESDRDESPGSGTEPTADGVDGVGDGATDTPGADAIDPDTEDRDEGSVDTGDDDSGVDDGGGGTDADGDANGEDDDSGGSDPDDGGGGTVPEDDGGGGDEFGDGDESEDSGASDEAVGPDDAEGTVEHGHSADDDSDGDDAADGADGTETIDGDGSDGAD